MGFDHAEVGGALLKEWKLPASLEESVRFHHQPSRAARFPLESSITHVADLITNALELGTSGERLVPALDRGAWDEIGLSASIVGSMTQQMVQQQKDTADLFLEEVR